MNLVDLSGRVVLVTGASKGIGYALAQALDYSSATLVLNARDAARLEAARRQLQAEGRDAMRSVIVRARRSGYPAGLLATRAGTGVDAVGLIAFLVVGVVAGWLAGVLVKGGGFGLLGDLVVGVVGAFVGGFLFRSLGLFPGGGMLPAIIVATIGAVVLLFLVRLVKRA